MMKAGRLLLDTNIISDINNGVERILAALRSAKEVFVSITVTGEIFYGIENSSGKEENLEFYQEFFQSCTTIDLDVETAKIYGKVKTQLKNNGTPIPENDVWIAAVALQHDLVLLTRDKHFELVDKLQRWVLD